MDEKTYQVLKKFGIPPEAVPPGAVKFLGWDDLRRLGEKSKDCWQWTRNPDNHEAIAYSVDHEHKACVGVSLRNLFSGDRRDHKILAPNLKPLWHNFFHAIPRVYKLGVVVLVEGPKDARVLDAFGIPVIACLMVIPSPEHLRVINRYAEVVIWIGDRDAPDDRAEIRVMRARRQAREIGLKFFEFLIPTKDPAELAGNTEWLQKIRDRVTELASFTS